MSESNETPVGLVLDQKETVPLKEIYIDATIVGFVARVESILTYRNDIEDPLEAVFTFPMEDASAVYKFEANIEGRHIVAEIQEREEAKLTYEDAQKEGDIAVLLKQDETASDIFSCFLGNLPPKCKATLIIGYVVPLAREHDGKLRFKLPTLLNPRYTPAGCQEAAEEANLVPSTEIPYTFNITVRVRGSQKVASITAEKEQLVVETMEDGFFAQATLKEQFQFNHDLSFLVEYENGFVPQAILEKGKTESDGLMKEDMLMLNFQPDLKEVEIATCGEFIFMIDRSGSMNGDKIDHAKEALLLFLKSLPPDCYFNIVSFGSKFSSLFRSSTKYTSNSLEKAMKLQGKMEADMGGTEILSPLTSVLKNSLLPEHPRKVFLLTDGQVSNTSEVISMVDKYAKSASVYAVAIGDGASTSLCEGVARVGNGRAEYISGTDRLQAKVISLLKEAMQPSVNCMEYVWDLPPGVTIISLPENLPTCIVAGRQMTVYAILQNVDPNTVYAESSLTLKGRTNGSNVEHTMTFSLTENEDQEQIGSVFHYLAAKLMIQHLEDSVKKLDPYSGPVYVSSLQTCKDKITSVSKAANVLSMYTAFVAIDTERREKVEGTKQLCPIPTPTKEFIDGKLNMSMACCGLMDRGLPFPDQTSVLAGDTQLLKATRYGCKKRASLPLFSCFGNKKNKKGKQYAANSLPIARTDCDKADEEDDLLAAEYTSDQMVKMVSLQCIHGNWQMTDDLTTLLNIEKDVLTAEYTSLDLSVLATIASVAWLRVNSMDRKSEWVILEAKALSWLQKENTGTKASEELISEFTTKYTKQLSRSV